MTNKYLLVFTLLISYISLFAQSPHTENPTIENQKELSKKKMESNSTNLVQQQLNAYNLRDIESFLKPYDDDIEAYIYPTNKLAFKGKDEMRKIYSKIFTNTPNLHGELVNRITQGNTVIDKERVQFGEDIIEAVAIYYIENNKITKIHFIY